MSWFERRYRRTPDPERKNSLTPVSRIKPDDIPFFKDIIREAIPGIEETGRVKEDKWDAALRTLSIKDLNEAEFVQIENVLRIRIKEAELDPSDTFQNQRIHSLRYDLHELWRHDQPPTYEESEDWLQN